MGEGAAAASGRARLLFAAVVVVAAAQAALGARIEYAEDYQFTLAIAWTGALVLVWQQRSRGIGSPGLALRGVGMVAAIGSVVVMVAVPGYRWFYRALPLVGGAGLALAAAGWRGWSIHLRPLLLLALPLVNPPTQILHRLFAWALMPLTTWCALALNLAVGNGMVADGHILRMPNDALDIVEGCCGMLAMTRLIVLAGWVIALFPTTGRQRVALVASALVIGFGVNAVRVAVLAASVFHGNHDGFTYWHVGAGATLFAVVASAVAGIAWWLMLRGRLPAPARLERA